MHHILFLCACLWIHDPLQAFKLIKNYVSFAKSMACFRFHAQVAWFIGFEAKAHGL
jgi:hypothetical protein